MTQQDVATWAPPAQSRKRRAGRTVFWVLVGVVTNVFVPSLDDSTSANAGPLVGRDAPSSPSNPRRRNPHPAP